MWHIPNGSINDTLEDVVSSCQGEVITIPDELVSNVLKHGSLDLYFCLVDQYYFAFLDVDGTPADLPPQTFVHPIVEVREDTRSIEELVQEIEGIKEDSIENGNEKKIMRH